MKRKFFFPFIALLILTDFLHGQSYYFRHYQVEDGLSHNSVICTLQDQEGFLWFGTKDGLNRFDGYSFKIFRHDPDDPNSIGSNFIQTLFEANGELWVGTNKGLYKYNAATENFSLVKGTLNNNIRDITMDNEANLWFISGYTPYKYNENKQTLQPYNAIQYSATSICKTSDGTIWFSTTTGTIHKYDPLHDSFASLNMFEKSEQASSNWIEKIYPAGKQCLLIGTQSQGIKLFDIGTSTYKDVFPHDLDNSELFVRDFLQISGDEYWVATESGIFIYNVTTGKFINLRKSYNNPYAISDNAIYSLCTDKEGGIWAGTYFGGINYYPKQYTPFKKFFPKSDENAIRGNAVREITEDEYGNLWIGTEDAGLNKFNPETGLFTCFKPTGAETSLSHYNIHALLATGKELWIGTFEHGLDVMDIKTGKVIRHYSAGAGPNSLKSNFIYSILQTRTGEILVGTSIGLFRYNKSSDDFKAVQEFPAIYHYTIMLEDHQGRIWGGTYRDGIYYFDPKNGKRGYFKYEPENKNSISSNSINGIFEDSKNILWFTTEGGLCKFNPDKNNFTRYTTENGLPSNVIYRILEDDETNLWISTSKGLVCFNRLTKKMKVYTKAHGLLSDQFNYSSSFKDLRGRMYFGSVNGLISFNPAAFIKNTFIPPIWLTGFQVNNEELIVRKNGSPLIKSITYTDKITLNHNQSSFSLDFAALSYTAPQMAAYAYKLEGLDKQWTYLKTNRKVYFTELAPGKYTFMVKASNSSGLWNDEATQLEIEILPPFWASSWAYFFYTALVILIVCYSIRFYHRQAEKTNERKIRLLENEKEKEIYQAKIEFFTNVAHEIRTPLTLIKGPLETVIKTAIDIPAIKNNLFIMEKNTQRLLDLANQLLDFRKTEIKGFSLTFVKANVSELLKETYTRFKPLADQKNLNFILNLPDQSLYAYVDPEALTKILSNMFSNAVKYASHSASVHLSPLNFKADKKNFTIIVKNDGPLIPFEMKEKIFEPFFRIEEAEKPGTGIGLPLARSLTELHKGTLNLNISGDAMNIFCLTLPIHQEQEFKLYNEEPKETYDFEKLQLEGSQTLKPVILLVDDNKEMLEFISDELIKEYTIIKTCNGEKALEILKKETIQLVISDVVMAVMDGFALCKRIKTTLDFSHIPIILLTAKNTMQAKIEGLECGADAYIEKPFSPDHLQVQISNLLTNRNKIKEFFSSSPLAHIKTMAYSKADELFLKKLNEAIHINIEDTDLNVEYLAEIMNMSRPTLYRKIKAISNLTPNELINIARLKKAAELLAEGDHKIYEVANIVGYSSQNSFGRNFHKQFGMTPSEYLGSRISVTNL